MKRLALLFSFALFLLLPKSVAAADCQFVLGFATLRGLIGTEIVGECLEDEHHNEIGDSVQQTTGGLMVWRKADNWTAFTDGYRSWIRGPNGLEQRLNIELLPWEAENAIAALPWVSDGFQDYWEEETARSLRKLQEASPPIFGELMQKPWIQSDSVQTRGAFLPMLYRQVLALTYRDDALALRVMRMPFMVDLGNRAETAWTVLNELYVSDSAGVKRLLAHPDLQDGITHDNVVLLPLLYLETRDPVSAAAIWGLPWIHQYPWEVKDLQQLALVSQPVFWAWMEHRAHEPRFGSVVEHISYMARVDEALAVQIVRMPFLSTRDGSDGRVIFLLSELARNHPEDFRGLFSHPKVQGGITDDDVATLYLLILAASNPMAAAAIEALPWVQDGLGRSIDGRFNSATSHPSEFEESVVERLTYIAERSPDSLSDLVSKSWLQDGLNFWEYEAVGSLSGLIGYSSQEIATARQILAMPFLETLEREDYEILETVRTLFDDSEGVRYIVSHPKLAGGIRDRQRATVALVRLEWEKPEAAQVIWSLPWIADGISASETNAALALYELAQNSTQSFQILAAKPWMQDYLSAEETRAIEEFSRIAERRGARRDEAAAQRIAAMPFLETISIRDVVALDSLAILNNASGGSRLQEVLSHPTLRHGIRDDQTALVAVLGSVASYTPELLQSVLAPGQAIVAQRTLEISDSESMYVVVGTTSREASENIDWLEHSVRTYLEYMGVPPRTKYLTLWVHNKGGGGYGVGHMHVGSFRAPATVAHETAHAYWPFFPRWLAEGGAILLERIAENKRIGSPISAVADGKCSQAKTLSEHDRLFEERRGSEQYGELGICPYSLGSGLFVDLYHTLGDGWFRQGFRRLYLKLRHDVHIRTCSGVEKGLCYLRAAFVTDADPQAAAAAEPVINRWYYGSEHGSQ